MYDATCDAMCDAASSRGERSQDGEVEGVAGAAEVEGVAAGAAAGGAEWAEEAEGVVADGVRGLHTRRRIMAVERRAMVVWKRRVRSSRRRAVWEPVPPACSSLCNLPRAEQNPRHTSGARPSIPK